jgi:hypothetical protein
MATLTPRCPRLHDPTEAGLIWLLNTMILSLNHTTKVTYCQVWPQLAIACLQCMGIVCVLIGGPGHCLHCSASVTGKHHCCIRY